MSINLMRPSALPAAYAPVPGAHAAAGAPQLPRVHQIQAEQPVLAAVRIDGGYGLSGFAVKDVSAVDTTKRDVRGVPPRGRPV